MASKTAWAGGAFGGHGGHGVPHTPGWRHYAAASLGSRFTAMQLRRIVALRKDGESWAFIAKTVGSYAGAVKSAWEGLPIALR